MNVMIQIATSVHQAESFISQMQQCGYNAHVGGDDWQQDWCFIKDGRVSIKYSVTIFKNDVTEGTAFIGIRPD